MKDKEYYRLKNIPREGMRALVARKKVLITERVRLVDSCIEKNLKDADDIFKNSLRIIDTKIDEVVDTILLLEQLEGLRLLSMPIKSRKNVFYDES